MVRSTLLIVALVGCSETPENKETPPGDAMPEVVDTATASCPPPTGAPVEHSGNIVANETWGAGIHLIKFTVGVRKNATLTLDSCAVVRVMPNYGIAVGTPTVGDGGTLTTKGTADRPVVIERANATTAWADVLVSGKGRVDLSYTKLIGGGGAGSRGGALLHIVGDQNLPLQALAKVNHVTLEGAAKFGVVTEGHGGFDPASDDLVVRGSTLLPMMMTAPALGTIPVGTYTGNTTDAIRISGTQAGEILDQDVAIHDRGVPYLVGGEGRFGELSVVGVAGTVPTLTIDPGVTLKFIKAGGLFIERASGTLPAKGALIVNGTADKPVVFTSAEPTPAPGDWRGMWFGGVPSAKNKVDHARIEFAGGATGTQSASCGTPLRTDSNVNEAAILIMGPPANAFVTNTTIVKSKANGIERAWRGAATSFLPTNTFTDVAYCFETFPKDDLGACPTPAPCPR